MAAGLPRPGQNMEDEYRRYWSFLKTEAAKTQFLVFLKERRDRNGDSLCGKLLNELVAKWLTEPMLKS